MREFTPEIKHNKPEMADKKIFEDYMRDLDLSPEDLRGKVLDIGSGFSRFAKYAKEHGISSKIYSLEPQRLILHREKAVQADVRDIPFKNESFDRVISNYSFPVVLASENREEAILEAPEILGADLLQSLTEMLRVLKPGGKIILSPIPVGTVYSRHMILNLEFDKILHELELQGKIVIEALVDRGQANFNDKSEQWYLIKIKKTK